MMAKANSQLRNDNLEDRSPLLSRDDNQLIRNKSQSPNDLLGNNQNRSSQYILDS